MFLLSVCALAWFLPWLYAYASPSPTKEPFLSYSPIINQWIFSEDGKYTDSEGKSYTIKERDGLLPQLYYKDLIARGTMPDTINGMFVDLPALRHAELFYTSNQRDINKIPADLYLIMESMPERVDLEDPKEAFRADDEIEFIDLATNEVNQKRSKNFNKTFKARDFKYPVRWANANVTARKQYDEGYLLIDNEGSLYHFKQQAGRPYLAKIKTDSVKFNYAFIVEAMDRSVLGFVVSEDNDMYLLRNDGGYSLEKLPVGKIDPATDRISILGNLFNRVFRFNNQKETRWYALNTADNALLDSFTFTYEKTLSKKISEFIFPFVLTFNSNYDSFGMPRIINVSYYALALNFLLAVILLVIFYKQNKKCAISASFVTLFLGIYSFIAFYLLKKS